MAIEYFCCYHSYLELVEQLNDEERGRLFTACLTYSKTGEAPVLAGNERFVFPAFRTQIDRDNQKYGEKCRSNAENGKKGGRPKKADGFEENPKKPTVFSETQKSQGKGEGEGKGKGKGKGKEEGKGEDEGKENTPPKPPAGGNRFVPPSLDDVRGYCEERGAKIDPEQFFDYYTANGWKVGKNPMKDWKAAVRNWERQEMGPPKQRSAGRRNDTGFETGNPFAEMLEEELRKRG